jgi:aspartyl-tRNA(Asn)/glutamyl-tRNA(Gln) amidotransferase subunit C
MVDVSEDELIHLAKLCRIACSPEKRQALLRDFQNIVHYVDQLSKIDTQGIEPCVCVSKGHVETPLRDDVVMDHLDREIFLQEAPSTIAGLVRVPTVIHGKEAK